jgi:hypothetical protein
MKILKPLAIAAALAAAITPAKADKASDLAVMLFYHDECANVLTPAELAYFKRVVAEAPSSSNPQRIVDNGLTMWRGKLNYCAMLTAMFETDLPEIFKRLSPETAKRVKDGWKPVPQAGELAIFASAAPSGDPQWPVRLTVRNDTDREIVATHWNCSNEPHPPGIGRWVPGVGLKGGRMAPHSVKSWNFRVPGNPFGGKLPFCKESFGHELLKRGAASQLNEPDEPGEL